MAEGFSPEFEEAILASSREFNSFHPDDSERGDLQMIAKGVKHSDIMLFAEAMRESYIEDLRSEDERREMLAISSIIQLALFAGQELEQGRVRREREILEREFKSWEEGRRIDGLPDKD